MIGNQKGDGMSKEKKAESGVDYKVDGANCSLKELCGFFKKFVNLTDGSEWKPHQAVNADGNKLMSNTERVNVMLEMEPILAPLYFITETKKDGSETCVAYTGFQDNALALIFFRNNVAKLANGCLQVIGDVGKMKKKLDRMKERSKDNDMIAMKEHREIVKGLQDQIDMGKK